MLKYRRSYLFGSAVTMNVQFSNNGFVRMCNAKLVLH